MTPDSSRGGRHGSGGDLPFVVRPRRLVRVCRAVAVLVVVAFTAVALALRSGPEGAVFGVADQVAMVVLGLLMAAGVLLLTRARVVADQSGVRVRNVLGERAVPWQVVAAVTLEDGASWAALELRDDDRIALLAVQANDGDRAVDAVLRLRALHRQAQER